MTWDIRTEIARKLIDRFITSEQFETLVRYQNLEASICRFEEAIQPLIELKTDFVRLMVLNLALFRSHLVFDENLHEAIKSTFKKSVDDELQGLIVELRRKIKNENWTKM